MSTRDEYLIAKEINKDMQYSKALSGNGSHLFSPKDVDSLFASPRVKHSDINCSGYLFVLINPCVGSNSTTDIVTLFKPSEPDEYIVSSFSCF
jgi:hypothetical protein